MTLRNVPFDPQYSKYVVRVTNADWSVNLIKTKPQYYMEYTEGSLSNVKIFKIKHCDLPKNLFVARGQLFIPNLMHRSLKGVVLCCIVCSDGQQ